MSEKAMAGTHPPRVEIPIQELEAMVERVKGALSDADLVLLQGVVQTLALLTRELEKKKVSVQRLKQLLFGACTETTRKVMEKVLEGVGQGQATAADAGGTAGGTEPGPKEKAKGHGRNGADAYRGAKRVRVPLGTLTAGDACPICVNGTVYASCEAGVIVRLTG